MYNCICKLALCLRWALLINQYNNNNDNNNRPYSIVENNSVKILWDFNIFVDHVISARRPDIVVIDKVSSVVMYPSLLINT